ncbi:replicative DNA helicase [Aquibacillus sediminis]|uniref:replicative DNA helicase n=1 Tax=Aquibacillus sediminis TaxID=2574734 RepID=UPI0011085DCE|nr:replicative DNA helicase [Aquibacillus sediminis]
MNVTNYHAEVAVLGAVLVEGGLFKELEVTEEHFYDHRHKRIFHAMKHANDQGLSIDLVTVTTHLGESIEQVGGISYLMEMTESVATTSSLPHHQQLIFDAYRNRKSRELVLRYSEQPSADGLQQLIGNLQTIDDFSDSKQEKQIYDHLLEITESMSSPPAELAGFETTYTDLDEMTGGFQRGDLIIVAARPSVGKTAFALNIAAAHCNQGGTCSFFSLEMGIRPLLQRIISSEAQIVSQKWRSYAFEAEDFDRATNVVGQLSKWQLNLYEKKRTLSDIRASLRKAVDTNPDAKHMAVIDYLQLITPTGKRERRDLEVGEMTRELKLLAIEFNIPIILLSQLSRGVEQRKDKRPLMSDLRESGNIEQDADVIAFLYRDDYYNKGSNSKDVIEVILSKQRNGPTGTVELTFLKEYGRFTNS